MTVVTVKYLEKFTKGAIIPRDLLDRMDDATLDGRKSIDVPQSLIDKLEEKLEKYENEERLLNNSVSLSEKGSKLEKEGKIDEAIKVYEKNIESGCYPAAFSFKRLSVIYRGRKDYDNELRVIERAIEAMPTIIEFIKRKQKVLNLIQKENAKRPLE